jgi:hypothetical protein
MAASSIRRAKSSGQSISHQQRSNALRRHSVKSPRSQREPSASQSRTASTTATMVEASILPLAFLGGLVREGALCVPLRKEEEHLPPSLLGNSPLQRAGSWHRSLVASLHCEDLFRFGRRCRCRNLVDQQESLSPVRRAVNLDACSSL